MRGKPEQQIEFLFVQTPEVMIREDHPIRRIKSFADRALKELSWSLHSHVRQGGKPSVPPERLLMALYSLRLER